MPQRWLREGILTSEPVNELSWPAEVFYRRLMSVVDDYGRYYANCKALRSACYPLRIDDVTDRDVEYWLWETRRKRLVLLYEVDGKQYIELQNFGQRLRSESRYPDPADGYEIPPDDPEDETPEQAPYESPAETVEFASHGLIEPPPDENNEQYSQSLTPQTGKNAPRGTRLPEDWQLPKSWGDWALGEGMSVEEVRREAGKFYNHWTAKTGRDASKIDWYKTWQNWIWKALEYRKKSGRLHGDELTNHNLNVGQQWAEGGAT